MHEAITVATSRGSDPASAPIGCVIVLEGRIVGAAHNECDTLRLLDL